MLRMRFDDFSRATRSHTLNEATDQTQVILATARGLLASATPMIERQGLTLIGLTLGNLEDDGAVQLALPFDARRASALDATHRPRPRPLRLRRDHAGRAARPRPGPHRAAAARLTRWNISAPH